MGRGLSQWSQTRNGAGGRGIANGKRIMAMERGLSEWSQTCNGAGGRGITNGKRIMAMERRKTVVAFVICVDYDVEH